MIQLQLLGYDNHADLVHRAQEWLYKRCDYVVTEMSGYSIREEADAIGWKGGASTLVECKASRSDFHADKRKPFREFPEQGMGNYRYYMTPPKLIVADELPPNWGLIYAHPKVNRVVRKATWIRSAEVNKQQENILLANALRNYRRGYWKNLPDEIVDVLQEVLTSMVDGRVNYSNAARLKLLIAKMSTNPLQMEIPI